MDKKNVQKVKSQKSLGKNKSKINKSQNIYWGTYLKPTVATIVFSIISVVKPYMQPNYIALMNPISRRANPNELL